MSMKRQKGIGLDDRGLVSILVAMMIMVLVTLIVLSYSRIVRRETLQVLDRQLSSQAFYAAESGVNAVANSIQNNQLALNDPTNLYQDTDCKTFPPTRPLNPILDNTSGTEVTCMKVDLTPPFLRYDISNKHSTAFTVKSSSGAPIRAIKFNWQKTGATPVANCSAAVPLQLKSASPGIWDCPIGMLRVDIVPTGGPITRASAEANRYSTFLYPVDGVAGGATTANTTVGTGKNDLLATQCSGVSPTTCTMNFTSLPGVSNAYTVRVFAVYGTSTLTITATDAASSSLLLIGAQASIDATGRAGDTLKRISVRVPLASTTLATPDFALQAGDGICKRYVVTRATLTTTVDNAGGAFDTSNLECDVDASTNPGPVPPPPPVVPPGDGFSPTLANGQIFSMFHHRVGLYIVCNNTDLTPCGYDTDSIPVANYITPQNAVLIPVGSKFYFPMQAIASVPIAQGNARNFGVGCFDYISHSFCGFANLGTTVFQPTGGAVGTNDFSAGIDNLVFVGGKLYTMAIDINGDMNIYCADPAGGVPVPCAGFTPFGVGVNMVNNTQGQYNVGFNVVANRIYFSANNLSGTNLGCYDTATRVSCWPSVVLAGVNNIAGVIVGGAFCVTDYNFSVTFTTACFSQASGVAVATPPNFLTGVKPAAATTIPGAFWANWLTLNDGSRIYLTGVNRLGGASGAGDVYCYDTATSNVCAGWGINGWADGFAVGNYFGDYEPYAVIHVGPCLYGIGDNPVNKLPPIFKFSPANAGPC